MPNLDSYKVPIITDVNNNPSLVGDEFYPNASLLCKLFNELLDIISSGTGGTLSSGISYEDRQKIGVGEYQNSNIILDVSFVKDPNFDYEGNGYYIGSVDYPYSNIEDILNYINGGIQFGYPGLVISGAINRYYEFGDLESESVAAVDLITIRPYDYNTGGPTYINISSLKYGGWHLSNSYNMGFKNEDNTGTRLNIQDCFLYLAVSDVSSYTGMSSFSSRLYLNRCKGNLGGYSANEKLNLGADDPNASVEIINSDIECTTGTTWPRATFVSPKAISFYGSKISFVGVFDYNLTESGYRNTSYYFEDCELIFSDCTIKNVPHKWATFNRCVIYVSESNFSINNTTPIFGETDVYTLIYNASSTLGVPTTGTASTIIITN